MAPGFYTEYSIRWITTLVSSIGLGEKRVAITGFLPGVIVRGTERVTHPTGDGEYTGSRPRRSPHPV